MLHTRTNRHTTFGRCSNPPTKNNVNLVVGRNIWDAFLRDRCRFCVFWLSVIEGTSVRYNSCLLLCALPTDYVPLVKT